MSAWLTVWDLLPVLLLGAVTTAEITAGAFVLATLIGLMMWFYITAYVVLFGAELNAALDREWQGHMAK